MVDGTIQIKFNILGSNSFLSFNCMTLNHQQKQTSILIMLKKLSSP